MHREYMKYEHLDEMRNVKMQNVKSECINCESEVHGIAIALSLHGASISREQCLRAFADLKHEI